MPAGAGAAPNDTPELERLYLAALSSFVRRLALALAPQTRRFGPLPAGLSDPSLAAPPPASARDAIALIVRSSTSPLETLSSLYGDLQRFRLCHVDGQLRWARVDHRKASGAFYTPPLIARRVVRAALRPLLEPAPREALLPAVLDPAMGTGIFLLEAARYLAESTGIDLATIATEALHGVDLDPLAVEVASLGLWLETGADPARIAQRLRCADALASPLTPAAYDAVVGNPPWGTRYSAAERAELQQRFPHATRGSLDSFKLFLDLAAQLSHGTVGMVVPQAMLAQSKHADVRAVLLERLAPYWLANLGNAFSGAAAPACALVFGTKPGPRLVECLDLRDEQAHPAPLRVPAHRLAAASGFLLADHGRLDLLQRLRAAHPSLGEVTAFYRVRDTGINYNRASVARRVLYAGPEPDDPRDIPRYRGRNFARYTRIERGGWLRHDAARLLHPGETLSLDWPTYRRAEKIVLRQTADRIIATLDRTGMAMGRSVLAITPEAGGSLAALLACLNSRLLTALYRTLAGEEGRILPQVKVARLVALPLPALCTMPLSPALLERASGSLPASGREAELVLDEAGRDSLFAWACLDRLARLLLSGEGEAPSLAGLVDRLVYVLYGLAL